MVIRTSIDANSATGSANPTPPEDRQQDLNY